MKLTRYLVLPQVFGIANAFAAPAWFQFYNDTGCRQSAIDTIKLTMDEDHISEACVLLYDDGMHNAGGLAIALIMPNDRGSRHIEGSATLRGRPH